MTEWIDVGALNDVPVRGARIIKTREGCVAVFRTADDQVYAIDNSCPHQGGPLSEGIVHGAAVTCPLHNWVISLKDGAAQGNDKGSVRTYPAQVEAGRILLDAALARSSKAA
ncbi:MAG: nitrite reductase small subunit NirD [Rhodobacteraceae bacterium]|nr:nitrite reductase small subunit NirD [Paracoccaceae bacterium]